MILGLSVLTSYTLNIQCHVELWVLSQLHVNKYWVPVNLTKSTTLLKSFWCEKSLSISKIWLIDVLNSTAAEAFKYVI